MRIAFIGLVALALTGCGLRTQLVHLDAPSSDRVVGTLKPVVIDSIVDARDFDTIPEGNAPRVDPKIAQQLGPQGRNKAVYGLPHAVMVTLLDDRTVPDAVRDVVAASLHSHGYEIVSADRAPPDTPHVQIKVTEFWSYMPFNFGRILTWTDQMKAWVTTDITIKTPTLEREFTAKGYGAHIVQTYRAENVQQAYGLALSDYRRDLDSKLFGAL